MAATTAGLSSLLTPSIGDAKSESLQKLAANSKFLHQQDRGSKWHHMIKCSSTETTSAGQSTTKVETPLTIMYVRETPLTIQPERASEKLVVKRRAAMVASMASFGFSACACCSKATASEEWSYGGPSGPPLWTGTCATGKKQSPVDVPWKQAQRGEAMGELMFDYQLSSPVFTNPGHGTMQVEFPEGGNKLRLNGRELNLVQFHFHTPSEHAFDGFRFPMEAHLVHQDVVTKATAVVGIMLDAKPEAKPNGALTAALRYSPLQDGKPALRVPKNPQVTPADLLPPTATENEIRRYIHYSGSLTTPTCDEFVDWFLLEKPLIVTTHEVLEFQEFVGGDQTLAFNARPVQPLNDRPIFVGP